LQYRQKKKIEELVNDREYFAKAYKAIHPDIGQYAEYRHLKNSSEKERWAQAFSKEVGNLFQGSKYCEQGTNTCRFIRKEDVPREEKVTYCRIVADYHPQKADPYRVRLTAGGELLDYPEDTGTRTADLTTVKCLLNSTISTQGTRFMCIDLKNFYLNMTLKYKRYMCINIADCPDDIIKRYKLRDIEHNGFVYVEISGGVYGLPEAGSIAN
jgi:hypothetical protein